MANPLYGQQINPAAIGHARADNPYHADRAMPRFPHVLTTYRLTEHHTAGAMSRWVPWLAELQPEGFAEIGTELAAELGVDNGDWVVISTAARRDRDPRPRHRPHPAADGRRSAAPPGRPAVALRLLGAGDAAPSPTT